MLLGPTQRDRPKNSLWRAACVGTLVALATTTLRAVTPLESLTYSPDITAEFDSSSVADDSVAKDDIGGTVVLVGIGSVPDEADLNGYHSVSQLESLLTFDDWVALPGGTTAEARDVVRFDGGPYSIEFDGSSSGVPS